MIRNGRRGKTLAMSDRVGPIHEWLAVWLFLVLIVVLAWPYYLWLVASHMWRRYP